MSERTAAVNDARLGFLGLFGELTDDDPLRGALMVTSESGYPLELQVATPIRPTRIQRAAYGDSLMRYAVSELVGAPLIEHVKLEPEIILVNRPDALDLPADTDVFLIVDANGYVALDQYESKLLAPSAARRPTMLVRLTNGNGESFTRASALLEQTRERFDPLGVFNRLKTTLEVLAETDDRYR